MAIYQVYIREQCGFQKFHSLYAACDLCSELSFVMGFSSQLCLVFRSENNSIHIQTPNDKIYAVQKT